MPATYTVQRAEQKKTVDGKYGAMQVITLALSEPNGRVHQAEWFTKATTPLPAPGSTLEGDLEDGQYGKSFKKAKPEGGFGGGGGMSPERQAAIQRQHSQEMALRTLALTPDSTHKLSDDELRRDIKSWTNWFDADVGGAPADSSLVAGTAHVSPGHTGFASDKQKAFFEKLLTERGVEAEPRGTVMLWASSDVPTERVSKAIDALKENHPAAVPALLSESEEWARQQSDIPGDERDLQPAPTSVIRDDSDIPY